MLYIKLELKVDTVEYKITYLIVDDCVITYDKEVSIKCSLIFILYVYVMFSHKKSDVD